jgi:hypothetical protein
MVMHMTGSSGVLSVSSEHLPGLVALVLVGPVVWMALAALRALSTHVGWAQRTQRRLDSLSFAARVALLGTFVGAVVHAVIVPTHWGDARVTAILFVGDAVGLAVAFWWTFTSRRYWQLVSAAMLGGTACAYVLYIVRGWETMDLVGLVTTTIEAAAALVVLSPVASAVPARQYAAAFAALPVAMLSLLGTNVIAGTTATAAPAATSASGPAQAPAPAASAGTSASSMAGMSGSGSSGAAVTALSLSTTSPAGNIEWPPNMSTMAAGMKMAEPNCTAQPTATQQHAAVDLVDQTVAAAQKFTSLAAATAAGYVPVTPSGARIVHYINPSVYRSGQALNPDAIPALVYVNTAHGAVLSAAMYLVPKGQQPPQPGGCLTQWHIHTNLCLSGGRVVGNDANAACAAGSVNRVTQPMMHVWMTPVTGGPLTPDPPALNEVEAALKIPMPNPPNATA